MSGISGKHGRHAKPGKLSTTKAKVTTTAAVTGVGVIVVGGGIAEAAHTFQGSQRNQQTAGAQTTQLVNTQAANTAAAQDIAARDAEANKSNRSAVRKNLSPTTAPTTAPTTQAVAPTASPTTAPTTTTPVPLPTSPSTTATTTKPTTPPPTTTSSPKATSTTPLPAGYDATPAEAQAIAQQLVPSGQYACFSNIITRESGWDLHATNSSSGAYGLPQALPGKKMSTAGSDWQNDATTQIKWALSYMDSRYGSPCDAWAFWQAHDWY